MRHGICEQLYLSQLSPLGGRKKAYASYITSRKLSPFDDTKMKKKTTHALGGIVQEGCLENMLDGMTKM